MPEDDPNVGITALKAAERGAIEMSGGAEDPWGAPEPDAPATEDLLTLSG